MELNNNNNNNSNNNSNNSNNNNGSNSNNNGAEWKIQLKMQNSCISTKSFEETWNIYTKSEPVKIFMDSDTKDVIDKLYNNFYNDFSNQKKNQIKEEANLFLIVLNYYIIIFKEQTLEELNHT